MAPPMQPIVPSTGTLQTEVLDSAGDAEIGHAVHQNGRMALRGNRNLFRIR